MDAARSAETTRTGRRRLIERGGGRGGEPKVQGGLMPALLHSSYISMIYPAPFKEICTLRRVQTALFKQVPIPWGFLHFLRLKGARVQVDPPHPLGSGIRDIARHRANGPASGSEP
jgi:hypothetical protein